MRDAIRLKVGTLADWPGLGHDGSDSPDPAYRYSTVKPYLIVYEHDDATLRVVRIIFGATFGDTCE